MVGDLRRRSVLDAIYRYVLPTVTAWDGARFLNLAVDPDARRPPPSEGGGAGKKKKKRWWHGNSGNGGGIEERDEDELFAASEQAHAFLPLWPALIRAGAMFLVAAVPPPLLPLTYEGVAALSALLLNVALFVLSAVLLHDMTYTVTGQCTADPPDSDGRLYLSELTASIFCLNPAGVFFTAAYSESTFTFLTFGGHALAARGRFVAAASAWALASCARSNGTLSSAFLLIAGLERMAAEGVECLASLSGSSGPSSSDRVRIVTRCLLIAAKSLVLAALVALPVLYHDQRGVRYHCGDEYVNDGDRMMRRPSWCRTVEGSGGVFFSLYAHVQRKHWNVGLFRYFRPRQIPNFALAAPVLYLGFRAASEWIGRSVSQYRLNRERISGHRSGATTMRGVVMDAATWAMVALSTADLLRLLKPTVMARERKACQDGYKLDPAKADILLGPGLLSHYAVLAGLCLIGAVVAHVQVTTRLVCSCCPAFYWYAALIVARSSGGKRGTAWSCRRRRFESWLLRAYLCLFNVLGSAMHVNFLPWT